MLLLELQEVKSNLSRDCLSIVLEYLYNFDEQLVALRRRLRWTRAAKERHTIDTWLKETKPLITVEEYAAVFWKVLQRFLDTPFLQRLHRGPSFDIFSFDGGDTTVRLDGEAGSRLWLTRGNYRWWTRLHGASDLHILCLDQLKEAVHTFGERCYPYPS